MSDATPGRIILTPDQRLRVFVSSTLQELAEERRAAREAIEHLRLAPVMFELGARPHPPRELYRAYLDQSHIFVGIYWQKYGWIAPGESISGLEDEYRQSGQKPKLIYIRPRSSPGPSTYCAAPLARACGMPCALSMTVVWRPSAPNWTRRPGPNSMQRVRR